MFSSNQLSDIENLKELDRNEFLKKFHFYIGKVVN